MSSTDDQAQHDQAHHEEIARIFREQMVPAGKTCGAFFPLGPQAELQSYFVTRGRRTMERGDFEIAPPEQLAKSLESLWSARGEAHLALLAQSLALLAVALRLKEEQTEDVSPFIYVMF